MISILHVVNIYFVIPYFIGDQFQYFKSKGFDLNIACSPSEYLNNYAKKKGFDFIETPIKRSISLIQDCISVYRIIKYIKRKKITIIVGHTPKGGLLAMVAGWICNVPNRIYFRHGLVYETSHGAKRFLLISLDRLTSICATKIVCVSPSVLKKSIEDKLAPAKKQKILGKGTCNGIDTLNLFNPANINMDKVAELRKKYNIKDGDFVIGYSGRLVKDKGIIELVQAFDKLENADNCKLLLVGMFEERDALPQNIKKKIMNDQRIIFTGFINGGMEYYYSMMNVYLLLSYREGFPTGVLEAQAMEKPIITTNVTGCCDSIIEGRTGLFVTHAPDDIVMKIDAIRYKNQIDGKNARKWVVKNFDSRIIWKEIEKLY